jgi:type IV pilus assembly protein PilB
MAQRLVRKLCSQCRKPAKHPEEALIRAGFSADQDIGKGKIYSPNGCDECTGGYKGRTGIFQVMPVTEAISTMILRDAGQDAIEKQMTLEGVLSLRQAGLNKVRAGITSLEEVLRVTSN